MIEVCKIMNGMEKVKKEVLCINSYNTTIRGYPMKLIAGLKMNIRKYFTR